MGKREFIFTSESVGEGHPDKVADYIADSILDECIKVDENSRVACEIFTTTNFVLVGGELSIPQSKIDIDKIVRNAIAEIGYNKDEYKFNAKNVVIENKLHEQSPDIAQGVTGQGIFKGQGAGDQGIMFGFACNETKEFMPATLMFSHNILKKATALRKSGEIGWLRPDSKSQISIRYENFVPKEIVNVVVSHQHDENIDYETIKKTIIEKIVTPVLKPTGLLTEKTNFFINPTGKFVIGGPHGDAGVTGRKIIVDSYGGMGRHGGGAFSGKDSSKVDRSATYMARYIAKNIVASGACDRCELQLSYAIGYSQPISIMIDTFGTGKVDENILIKKIIDNFDLSPAGIVKVLDLKKPIFKNTTFYGHFGKDNLSWEKLDKIKIFK